jgi:hypothetical protein
LCETLICQIQDAAHVHVEPVKILEESLHPFDHDLVVAPSQFELNEELFASQILQPWHDFSVEIADD